jgi:serine phosphatase RsbU (regulator of sigma subunit)
MFRKPSITNNIAFQAALIIIGLSMASLVLSIYLYRESMREIALKEVENKATIFLSAMETSVRRLAMEKNTRSIIELIEDRAGFIDGSLNFAIVGVIVRDSEGVVLEHKIKDPDGLIYDPGRPKGLEEHRIPKDFQEVINTGVPLVKRQVKQLKMVEGQPVVRVIEALYPITRPQKGELLAVIKLVISVERTFEMIQVEYEKIIKHVILGFTVATILLILGIMFFLRRRIIFPVLSINDGANEVASGNLDVKLTPSGSNEISSLMHSFNKMVEGLKHRDQMRQSLEVAKQVQQNLLPQKNPEIEGLEIAGQSVYCDETGGDYYDYIELNDGDDNRLAVVIGDVSGHGISSALLMASTRAFLRQRAALPGSVAEIVSDVNSQFSRDVANSGSFMSMFYLTIDKTEQALHWVRAGHDPAVFYDPELDALSELKGSGIALGVDEDFRFEEHSRSGLKAGQIILLGTDGIWEARNPEGDMFGKEPLYRLLKEHKDKSSSQIVEEILQLLHEFQRGTAIEDDVTLIVIRVTQNF